MKISRHYLGLALTIGLGFAFRFCNLNYKPLWLDEVITALFTSGKSYNDIPVEQIFSLHRLPEIFKFNSSISCQQIAQNIASQSTHPPLFFCLMHYWLAKFHTDYSSLIAQLRSLPALFGVGAIAAVYYLNRVAFSKSAGLMAAAFMAVSPFGVYISQEARHYTLPVLLITLSLASLIQIQQDFGNQKIRPIVWLSWVVINTIGLYVHYFFILALIAESIALLVVFFKFKPKGFSPLLAIACWLLPFIFFIPWLPTTIGHFTRPETSWLPTPQNIAPIYQTLAAWVLMTIALPVENQPIWVIIPAGLLMLLFGGWLGWQVFLGLKELIGQPTTRDSTLTLGVFTIGVLLQFFAIVYLLHKDITIAPRYNFVYYPVFCALVAASLVNKTRVEYSETSFLRENFSINQVSKYLPISLLVVGILSCIFVVNGLAFLKPYNPQQVAKNMLKTPDYPMIVLVAYTDSQDIALGMSFALAIDKFGGNLCTLNNEKCPKFVFFKRSPDYDAVWQKLSKLPSPSKLPLKLWVVGPGLKRQSYPPQLLISDRTICHIDPNAYYRIGIPYQLYRCGEEGIGNRGERRGKILDLKSEI